jgi:hypothetical protein
VGRGDRDDDRAASCGAPRDALLAGLDAIGDLLSGKPIMRGEANAFSDGPIEDAGS